MKAHALKEVEFCCTEHRGLLNYLKLTQTDEEVVQGLRRTRLRTAGWLENNAAFYTGSTLIHHESVDLDHFHIEPIQNAAFAVRGTLDEWKDNIGCHIERNPSLLGISCIYLLSLFLNRLNLGTRLFNLWGTKGSGKTLPSQCAASLFGNGIDPAVGHYSEDPKACFSATRMHHFHFAMAADWHGTTRVHSPPIGDTSQLVHWVAECAKYVKTQVNYMRLRT